MTDRQEIQDFIKMVRLREKSDVHPDAGVERYGKRFKSLEDYLEHLLQQSHAKGYSEGKEAVECKGEDSPNDTHISYFNQGYRRGIDAAIEAVGEDDQEPNDMRRPTSRKNAFRAELRSKLKELKKGD